MSAFQNYYAVIMAGGGGTRLWPLSRKETPKQMVNLDGKETLFQMAVNRLNGLFDPSRILVVTVAEQATQLQKQAPQIPAENYLLEPFPKGTASVVGFAAAYLKSINPNATMAVLTADHFIQNVPEFQNLLKNAYDAAQNKALVTLGIEPTYPATGFGYIQRGELIKTEGSALCYQVLRFKEKPSDDLAKEFINRGDHDWNSGMFIWRVDQILVEFERQMPALFEIIKTIQSAFGKKNEQDIIRENWSKIKATTIDYGIMENAANVVVLPAARLGWNDVGSWDSLFDVIPNDEKGNVALGINHIGFDTEKTLVYSQTADRIVVTIGLKNTIVVEAGNAILVCDRAEAQNVKDVVKFLTENGYEDYL
jgi:mannose-1-phosphate guanylyltransferase